MVQIVFIVQQLSQPRCIKRISSIQEAGIKVKVYGFDSGLYNDSLKSLSFPVEEIIHRSKSDRKIKKISLFVSTVHRILKANKTADLFYVFGYELGACIHLLGCRNYVYEEADVSAARVNNKVMRKLMLSLDRRIISHSYRTVLTSEGFVPCIFPQKAPFEKMIMMPNKLSPFFDGEKKAQVKKTAIDVSHIIFSFIGLIRYPNTIIRFARVIGREFPQHEFHFFGEPEKEEYIDEEIKKFKNVFLHGRFKNPDDLQKIYEQTDISIVCYDTRSGNVKIAEPNKIYESIFFETPLVVSSGTFLSERVKQLNAGYDIDASNDNSIIDFIAKLNQNDLNSKIKAMHAVPWQETVDNAEKLIEAIYNFKQ